VAGDLASGIPLTLAAGTGKSGKTYNKRLDGKYEENE
jgi:hypothetical protein